MNRDGYFGDRLIFVGNISFVWPCEKSEKFQQTVSGDRKWAARHTSLEIWGAVQDGNTQKWWSGVDWAGATECI